MAYVEKHRLYEPALAIWRGTDQFKACSFFYIFLIQPTFGIKRIFSTLMATICMKGENIERRREVRHALADNMARVIISYFLVFVEASKLNKAMVAHEKALQWQELFDLAVQEHTSQEDLVAMGYRVAGMLSRA